MLDWQYVRAIKIDPSNSARAAYGLFQCVFDFLMLLFLLKICQSFCLITEGKYCYLWERID